MKLNVPMEVVGGVTARLLVGQKEEERPGNKLVSRRKKLPATKSEGGLKRC